MFSSGLVREPFTLLWHAGEPLVVPVAWYETAAVLLHRYGEGQPCVTQAVQTNATLIDKEWCDYFRRHDIEVGVSVDGPAFLTTATVARARAAVPWTRFWMEFTCWPNCKSPSRLLPS
jgi:uncharacterized protein